MKEFERIELREPYEFCIGISAEQKDEALHWLELAAKAGDLLIVAEYAAEFGDTPEALNIWETLWQSQGYSGSLSPLAIKYRKGVVTWRAGLRPRVRVSVHRAETAPGRLRELGQPPSRKLCWALWKTVCVTPAGS